MLDTCRNLLCFYGGGRIISRRGKSQPKTELPKELAQSIPARGATLLLNISLMPFPLEELYKVNLKKGSPTVEPGPYGCLAQSSL